MKFLSLKILDHDFQVQDFEGVESLSSSFEFKVKLTSKILVDSKALLIQNATLCLYDLNQNKARYFNGWIHSVECNPYKNSWGEYELKINLCDWLKLFDCTQDYRIFRNKSALEILEELFKKFPEAYYDFSLLKKRYPPIKYNVQYAESTTGFINRVLSENGISYYFSHEPGRHYLRCFDDISAYQPYSEVLILNPDIKGSRLWYWEETQTLGNPNREYIDAEGNYFHLAPCTSFESDSHHYAIVEIQHKAFDWGHKDHSDSSSIQNTQSYLNFFTAIPWSEYRAPHILKKPQIPGLDTAIVAGDPNDNTLINDEAEIEITPHWARASTKGIEHQIQFQSKTTQLMAGEQRKAQFIPRPGTEVLISHSAGPVEYPLIIAQAYNAKTPPPFDPILEPWKIGLKTMAAGGSESHELSFDNRPDAELIKLHTPNEIKISAQGSEILNIKGNYIQNIHENSKTYIKGHHLCEAEEINLSVGGSSSIKILNDLIIIKGLMVHLNS